MLEQPRHLSANEKIILKAIETVFASKGDAVVESNKKAFLAGRKFAEN